MKLYLAAIALAVAFPAAAHAEAAPTADPKAEKPCCCEKMDRKMACCEEHMKSVSVERDAASRRLARGEIGRASCRERV